MVCVAGGEVRPSILLVESDQPQLAATRQLFESAGFRVMSASSFDEAKRLITIDPPDVLVTDLRLGPYNGLHLVLRSRSDHPRMGAIVTSKFADAALEAEAARQNAAFLVRPFGDGELLGAVTRCLNVAVSMTAPAAIEKFMN